jgi:hypothetical protein
MYKVFYANHDYFAAQTIDLSNDEVARIIGALELMWDIDNENGHEQEAHLTRELIDRLRLLEDTQ